MNWKQKIEAQIASYSMGGNCLPDVCAVRKANCCPCTATAKSLRALLDVAIAADDFICGTTDQIDSEQRISDALDKCRSAPMIGVGAGE